MKRCGYFLLFVMMVIGAMCGCSKEHPQEGTLMISYLDMSQTRIAKRGYEPNAALSDTMLLVQELLDVLSSDSGDVDFVRPIPEGVEVDHIQITEEGDLSVYFNEAYLSLESVREILCRLALVQTLTQVDGVKRLEFYVGHDPLLDSQGKEVGWMTTENFVENPGEQINSIHHATLDLYFSNQTGDGLVLETQKVYYNSNVSLEKLVIEHLLAGPKMTDAISALPQETALINVSVADRVCYVSLDSGFRTQNYEIQEPIVIYSLVDSLTALPHIDKVQISVNGDTSGVYRENFSLGTVYEEDLSYVRTAGTGKAVVVNDIKEDKGGAN